MTPITTAGEIARPPEDVFAYVTDPARFHEWQQGVVSGRMDDEGGSKAGDKCHTIRRVGGTERPITSVITHIDPPRTWGVQGVDGPIRATVDVTVTPRNEGRTSQVEIQLEFIGHGIGRLLVPLFVRRSARKEMPKNMAQLKQRLERANGK
jgi:uncharacterized protein YndB with AHSA1/START domain